MEKGKKQQRVRPVHEVVIPFNGSLLKAAIWRHQQADKRPRFSVSLSRGYRAKEGGKWQFGSFFQRDETIGLVRLLEETHRWIVANDAKKEEPKNE